MNIQSKVLRDQIFADMLADCNQEAIMDPMCKYLDNQDRVRDAPRSEQNQSHTL